MSKYIKIQENVYNTYLALKSRRKRLEFLEKCFIFAWEEKEIKSKDDLVSVAFLGVKPSLKKIETSINWGGSRENSGRKSNQNKNQLENQDEIKLESSSFISNKEISNKKENNNILPEQEDEDGDDKDNPKWTDLDRWQKGWVDRTKYQICYKGIVPIDWKPTKEDYKKSCGYPWLYDNLPNRFVFEGKIIKIDEKDYNKWKKEFPNIDLKEELYSLDLFYQEEKENGKDVKGWFFRVPKALQKKNIQNKRQIKEYW